MVIIMTENIINTSVYIDNGYSNRADYLTSLADEYDVPEDIVTMVAELLGPNEDFDGLVVEIQDYVDQF